VKKLTLLELNHREKRNFKKQYRICSADGLDIIFVDSVLATICISTIALVLIMFLILWLFYKLTYGKLLKEL